VAQVEASEETVQKDEASRTDSLKQTLADASPAPDVDTTPKTAKAEPA
jgi:hypothetical protein